MDSIDLTPGVMYRRRSDDQQVEMVGEGLDVRSLQRKVVFRLNGGLCIATYSDFAGRYDPAGAART